MTIEGRVKVSQAAEFMVKPGSLWGEEGNHEGITANPVEDASIQQFGKSVGRVLTRDLGLHNRVDIMAD